MKIKIALRARGGNNHLRISEGEKAFLKGQVSGITQEKLLPSNTDIGLQLPLILPQNCKWHNRCSKSHEVKRTTSSTGNFPALLVSVTGPPGSPAREEVADAEEQHLSGGLGQKKLAGEGLMAGPVSTNHRGEALGLALAYLLSLTSHIHWADGPT